MATDPVVKELSERVSGLAARVNGLQEQAQTHAKQHHDDMRQNATEHRQMLEKIAGVETRITARIDKGFEALLQRRKSVTVELVKLLLNWASENSKLAIVMMLLFGLMAGGISIADLDAIKGLFIPEVGN